jgi:Lrp/AsnC family leucine-responsive transcriptional regulator
MNIESLDALDTQILNLLQEDCRLSLKRLANELGVPKSTVHYRIKRLEADGIIAGYGARVNVAKLGKDYVTLTFVRTKYGRGYHERIGTALAALPGVAAVYLVFGEADFVVLIKSKDRTEYMETLENIINMTYIERTHTQIIARTIKENSRVTV